MVSAVATPLGVLAARSLAFHACRWPAAGSALLLAPLALPAFVAVFALNVLLVRLQVPSYAGLVLVLAVYALPYTRYVMRLAYAAHDMGFEERGLHPRRHPVPGVPSHPVAPDRPGSGEGGLPGVPGRMK